MQNMSLLHNLLYATEIHPVPQNIIWLEHTLESVSVAVYDSCPRESAYHSQTI